MASANVVAREILGDAAALVWQDQLLHVPQELTDDVD